MSSITIRKVGKSYGAHDVLFDIDIPMRDGEFISLVGPSGCGKSTLLRMIAGLETVTSGEILIGERLVNDTLPKDRNVAMVFQNYALYPHMTVAENIGFSLKMGKVPKPEIARRVADAAAILGLSDYLDRQPRNLSGGQRQRVAMGRAIVRNPEAFLFDEPLSNLDAQLRVSMRAEIGKLHRRLGTTMVYVTHDQIEAMTMSDRMVVMRAGRIEQIGTPLEIYDRPQNLFVAGFIGSPAINLLTGTIAHGAEPGLVFGAEARLAFPAAAALAEGRQVTVGIRPEHVSIAPEGLPLRVEFVEPTGAETLVVGEMAGQPFTAALRGRQLSEPGELFFIRPDPATIHLFDPGTGQRIELAH